MELSGRKVSVLGAGKSGIAVAELLCREGAEVLVSELGRIGAKEISHLQELQIPFEQEGHSELVYDTDFCVISPGISSYSPIVKTMQAKNIVLYSEIEIAALFCKARVVGITGTDGKTTTSTLIHRICEADGILNGYKAFSVGNIGVPFSSMVQKMNFGDVAIVELSSYQLERCFAFRPDIALITNITPDHLDRYDFDLQKYANAKFRIYSNQGENDTLIYNEDDPMLREHFRVNQGLFPFRIMSFGMNSVPDRDTDRYTVFLDGDTIVAHTLNGYDRVATVSDFLKNSFRGRHNIYNVLAAVSASKVLGIGNDVVRSVLREFKGVEHRQEFVTTINGIDWINDSKATNINAMRQALEAIPNMVVLIAGGRDKGNDYQSIANLVREKVSLLVAFGESTVKIVSAFEGIVVVKSAESLEQAVSIAYKNALRGQTVMFSPGCASFDMFENFEERGKRFKQYVYHLQS
ncbi:MAG: UDP-N-acetylmuramoyl-L-alanine--D-glutamate ligase [Chlorobiaceae bacterium]